MPDHTAPARDDAFYVGSLPLPWAHSRVLRVLIPALLVGMAIVNGLIVWRMRAGGDGVWVLGTELTIGGTLVLDPYPMIVGADASGSHAGAWLLVGELKTGARGQLEHAAPDGIARGRIRGWELRRGDMRMLALAPDATLIDAAPEDPATTAGPDAASWRFEDVDRTLAGELVDGKCYLGAMKPGVGIAHSPCARLCIEGGIPPMLVLRDGLGRERAYLVVAGDSGTPGPAPDEVAGLVGGAARVTGRVGEGPGGVRCVIVTKISRG